jgi:hypothetical protein
MNLALAAAMTALEADPNLPGLGYALNPECMTTELRRAIRPLVPSDARIVGVRSRVLAYKPGRRCVIAYQVDVRCGAVHSSVGLVGKMRARKNGERAYALLRTMWDAGFAADSADAISVPQPIGVVAACGMWLQRHIDGPTLTMRLARPDGVSLAERVADAAHKLHRAHVPAAHRHTIADEVRILDRCFADVAAAMPDLAARLARLADACHRIAAVLPEPAWCGSHRDFYSDQLLLDRDQRLFVIDFDLYCEADPGLDVGNFLGHVTEHALRHCGGDASALEAVEHALQRRFGQLAGSDAAFASRAYAALTIARHVYLSRRHADRHHTTRALLTLAEERVQAIAAEGGHA